MKDFNNKWYIYNNKWYIFFFRFIKPIKLYIESENQYVTTAAYKCRSSTIKIYYYR